MWNSLASSPKQLSSDPVPEKVEVCVVGGGLAGVCCGLFLAEGGAKVAVLESGPGFYHRGGSVRESGSVHLGVVEHPYRIEESLGFDGARQLYEFSAQSLCLLKERVEVDPTGGLWIAMDEREKGQIDRSVRLLTELGFSVQHVSEEGVRERLGVEGCGTAMALPDDGLVNPVEAISTLASSARAAGAHLVHSTRVVNVDQDSEGLLVYGEDGCILRAEVVVVAAGAWSPQLSDWFEDKVIPVREQALVTSPVGLQVHGANRAGYGYTNFRQIPDGGVFISGCRWATPHMELGEMDESVIVEAIQSKLISTYGRLFPREEKPIIRERWAWLYARTCDMLPIIGPLPGNPRLVACTGFVGNPYGLAPAAARVVADGLLGEHSPELPKFMSALRFV